MVAGRSLPHRGSACAVVTGLNPGATECCETLFSGRAPGSHGDTGRDWLSHASPGHRPE